MFAFIVLGHDGHHHGGSSGGVQPEPLHPMVAASMSRPYASQLSQQQHLHCPNLVHTHHHQLLLPNVKLSECDLNIIPQVKPQQYILHLKELFNHTTPSQCSFLLMSDTYCPILTAKICGLAVFGGPSDWILTRADPSLSK